MWTLVPTTFTLSRGQLKQVSVKKRKLSKKIEREIKTTLLEESDHLCAVSHWDGCWMSSMEIGWTPWPIEPLITGWQLELKGSFTSKAAVIFFGHFFLNWRRKKLLLFLCQLFEGELTYNTNRESVWLLLLPWHSISVHVQSHTFFSGDWW